MSITRRAWQDDDGSGTTGTILDNAELQRVYDDHDARWSIYYSFSTGTANNLSITSSGLEGDVLVCSNASDLTITGIAAPASPAKTGKPLTIVSDGAGHVFLAHNSGSSSAGNKLWNQATTANTPLKAGKGWARYVYDGNTGIWRLAGHDQGGLLVTTFAAGNFTGNGSMTWTLASGDRDTGTGYWLRGNALTYQFKYVTTTVGGTPNTTLQVSNTEWGGFTAGSIVPFRRLGVCLDNAVDTSAYVTVSSGTIQIIKTSGNWTASTDNTYVYGDLTFEVT